MRYGLAIILTVLISVSICSAEGLSSLMEIAKSQKDIQKKYDEETKAFNRIRKAIEAGAIQKGQSKIEISNRYGEPIVIIPEAGTRREKWVYKPVESTYFKGIKAYLFFDKDNKLDEAILAEETKKENK